MTNKEIFMEVFGKNPENLKRSASTIEWWDQEFIPDYEDAISRQAALDLAYDMSEIDGEHFTEPCMVVDVEDIQKLPSVNPQEPKTGHWIELDECSNSGYYCSECRKKVVKEGWSNTVNIIKYCPNCGARMVEPQERNDKKCQYILG